MYTAQAGRTEPLDANSMVRRTKPAKHLLLSRLPMGQAHENLGVGNVRIHNDVSNCKFIVLLIVINSWPMCGGCRTQENAVHDPEPRTQSPEPRTSIQMVTKTNRYRIWEGFRLTSRDHKQKEKGNFNPSMAVQS